MPGTQWDRDQSTGRMLYLCVCVLLCALVLGAFVYRPGIDGYSHAMFSEMVYGTAAKPYVYRTLLPTAVRVITAAMPGDSVADFSESLARSAAAENLCKILGWEERYVFEYLVTLVLMGACLWGFVWSLRYLLNGVYGVSERAQNALVLLALAGLPVMFRYYSYIYDFTTLFLFTLGLGLMVRRKWGAFLAVYVIACVNKETTILLTMVFTIHFLDRARLERAKLLRLVATQLLAFAVVKTALFVVFYENPGSFLEVHLAGHNLEVIENSSPAAAIAWGGFALLLFYKWSSKPVFLRHGLWIALPLVIGALVFGHLDELRAFYEVYPIVVLLLLHTVGRLVGFEVDEAARVSVP